MNSKFVPANDAEHPGRRLRDQNLFLAVMGRDFLFQIAAWFG
jgi:hypothetical protein